MTARRPRAHAARQSGDRPGRIAVVTVSDTRGEREDASGARIEALAEAKGHVVISRDWVRDEVRAIRAAVRRALRRSDCDVVVLTGGTGLAARDVTPEAVEPLLQRMLPGFGEQFRAESRAQVGRAAWLSRAGAGLANGKLVVYLPGSPRAVELALGRLLLPEMGHLLRLLARR